MEKELTPEEVSLLLRGNMGLIVGPDLTLGQEYFQRLKLDLDERFSNPGKSDSFLDALDFATRAGNTKSEIYECLNNNLSNHNASHRLKPISQIPWSAVLSLSFDNELENLIQNEQSKNPTRAPVLIVDDLRSTIRPRVTPSFKVLGDLVRQSIPLTRVDYVKRRTQLRSSVQCFSDLVKGNPIFCLGLSGDVEMVFLDLMAELLVSPTTIPSAIILVSNDPLRNNRDFLDILGERVTLFTLNGQFSELISAVKKAAKFSFSKHLPFPADDAGSFSSLRTFNHLAVCLNDQLKSDSNQNEHYRLLDILFSPSMPEWSAHNHDLDFKRTLGNKLFNQVKGKIALKSFRDAACIVTGGAASGKTMLLKRLAFDLASDGEIVLWMRPFLESNGYRHLKNLMESVTKIASKNRNRIICFLDDPFGIGSFSARDIAGATRDSNIHLMLVTSLRTTEHALGENEDIVGDLPILITEQLSDTLDEFEWDKLPDYLVKLKVAATAVDAQDQVNRCPGRDTRDTLSLLYWLLPNTKESISHSVRDEYFRLGDRAGFTKILLDEVEHTSQLLKDAYELVAVADSYGVFLPIEVLVSCLKVDYHAWLSTCNTNGPAWGLFYDEMSDDGQTVVYRTRNHVVTDTLLQALNGGKLSRNGEIARLREMIAACTGRTSQVYEQFCVHLLVKNERFDSLGYQDGIELYDLAIKGLSLPHKTLVHQKGRWIRKKGRQPKNAEKVLLEALATPNYPHAIQKESDDHIYTSLASSVVDQIDAGDISLDEGKVRVYDYLNNANKSGGLNANAVHVQGKIALRLIPQFPHNPTVDAAELFGRALADIDRVIMMISNPLRQSHKQLENKKYLEDIRDKIFDSLMQGDNFDQEAMELWKRFKSPTPFTIAARKKYRNAMEANKGNKFKEAYQYCEQNIEVVELGNVQATELHEVAVQILYTWRIQRQIISSVDSPVDWEKMLYHTTRIITSPEYNSRAFPVYLHAISLSHKGEWTKAGEFFRRLRSTEISPDTLWEPRDFLLNQDGRRRLLQGKFKRGASRDFFFADELQQDFQVDRSSRWEEGDVAEFAYIQFSFAGPRAVDRHAGMS